VSVINWMDGWVSQLNNYVAVSDDSMSDQTTSHNYIATAVRGSPSLDSFKRHLNTHYFASP